MSNNKPKKEITETMKKDYLTNKLLLVFTFAFVFLLYFVNINRMMSSIKTFKLAMSLARNSIWIGVALLSVGVIVFIIERILKTDTKYRLFSGKNIFVVSAVFTIAALLLRYRSWADTLTLIYIFIPALVVLYIVYHSYQREFFMIVLSSILSGVAIWLIMSDLIISGDILIFAAVEIVILLVAIFTIVAHSRGGNLMLFGREFTPFKKDAKYALFYIASALSILLLAAAFFFPAYALYFIFALVAYILITGIYFTVKLI